MSLCGCLYQMWIVDASDRSIVQDKAKLPTSTLTEKALQRVGIQRDLLEETASRAVNTTIAMLNRWGFRQGDIIEEKASREVNTTRSPLPC